MLIANERHGFATNSSSTHFIVFFPKGAGQTDRETDGSSYGWGNFILRSPEAKLSYLMQSLRGRLSPSPVVERAALSVLMGEVPEDFTDGYIDHQSAITWPRMQPTGYLCEGDLPPINMEFVEDFKKMLLDPRIAIYGGNDNEGSPGIPPEGKHTGYLYGNGPTGDLPIESDDLWFARKDGDWWTLFGYQSGTRMTVTFNLDLAYNLG